MSPANEQYLWDWLRFYSAHTIIGWMLSQGVIGSPKQAWRTLEKWTDKGWYDYGVCLDLGWRTIHERPRDRLPKSDKP